MSTISADTQVAALVLEQSGRVRVFEHLGIDYILFPRAAALEAARQRLSPATSRRNY